MRMILLVIFIIVGIYSILTTFEFITSEKEEMEKIVGAQSLKEKIKIPNGLEKEYALILEGKNPFESLEKYNSLSENEHKPTTTVSQMKDLLKEDKKIEKSEIQPKNKINKVQHRYVKAKIKSYKVQNENLLVDLYLKNTRKSNIKGFVKLQCNTYNKDNVKMDIFSWTGNLSINANKVILLKESNFGYAALTDLSKVWCHVTKITENY